MLHAVLQAAGKHSGAAHPGLPLPCTCSPLGGGPAAALRRWQPIALGLAGGFIGSLIDSLLGATIQFTGYNRVTGETLGGCSRI